MTSASLRPCPIQSYHRWMWFTPWCWMMPLHSEKMSLRVCPQRHGWRCERRWSRPVRNWHSRRGLRSRMGVQSALRMCGWKGDEYASSSPLLLLPMKNRAGGTITSQNSVISACCEDRSCTQEVVSFIHIWVVLLDYNAKWRSTKYTQSKPLTSKCNC
jgi:hypothetical protein